MIVLSFFWQGLFGKRAYLRLMEGEEADLRSSPWLYQEKGLLVRRIGFPAVLGLEEVRLVRDREGSMVPESHIYLGDLLDLTERRLTLKGPLSFRGANLYQTQDWGYVLEFLLLRPGEPHRRMFYFAQPRRDGTPPFSVQGAFLDTGYKLRIEFYPDMMHRDSWRLRLPGARVTFERDGRRLFSGWVLYSQRVRLGEDGFYFAGISRWTAFILTADQGEPILYTGFVLTILGGFLLYGAIFRWGEKR
ncbi:MAG TPA: hypothetical protein ENJ40_08035 [Thermosulfurimonas dismutans]|uniref:ResB-like domain-containing protein n=1 Tax=Thermosulfurimonas dismutans TaxID=999894 RepID=A0A7C3H1U4_9BACT|nr:hypothetical protein [Thermosulfurimonas dismutans]